MSHFTAGNLKPREGKRLARRHTGTRDPAGSTAQQADDCAGALEGLGVNRVPHSCVACED